MDRVGKKAEAPAKVVALEEVDIDGRDRRRSTREPVVTLGMIREIDCPENEFSFPTPLQVLITDVSLHGVGFRSPEALESTALYVIEIGVGPLHLSSRFRVVRSRSRQDGTYDVGGEFC
jgi:hypothetical protein